ncbi:MAG: TonB-dependent receptor [Xanthomonadales bacterium]|nr:TonB-dependent receptor [Xanthomonadales bacterium]
MKPIQLAASLVLAGVLTRPAVANPEEPAIELEPIQVRTASRTTETTSDALASVSVISAEDIRRSAARDLSDLLRLEAGIDVVRTGGPGQQTSVFMRGANSNHALVLIDGIRVSSAHTGAYAWEHLPLGIIERVEIVRGPRGSLYGSDAIGGVIQVFTRMPDAPFLRASLGSHASRALETGTGFALGAARFSLSAGYRELGGYSAQNPDGFSFHPDDDGFEARNIHLAGNGNARAGDWQFQVTATDNEVEFDQGISVSEQVLASLSLDGQWNERWNYRFYAGWADDRLSSDFGFFTSHFDSERIDLGWENRLRLEQATLVFGLDHYDEQGRSQSSYFGSRDNSGLFALWERDRERVALQLSGRIDDNSLFGTEVTHHAAVRIAVGAKTNFILSHGTAFRAPTLSEQFSPGFGGLFAGNPALEPETSETTELSVRFEFGPAAELGVAAYRSRVDDLIAYSGPNFQAVNINRAALDGLELEYRNTWRHWSLNANLTLQETEDRSTGAELLRRPEQKSSLRMTRQFAGGAWLAGEWFASGDQADVGGVRLPGYSLLNLSAGLPLAAGWTLEARLDNLLDHDYQPAHGFNGAGRAAYLGIAWSP